MRNIGLRVDVDTLKGTLVGVPNLLEIFDKHGISASFFFSMGPDNMGRHLWRIIKPKFLLKMLRSNAVSLYGLDILLAGTCWPGKIIGKHITTIILETQQQRHEIGLHAWDHHGWQINMEYWPYARLVDHVRQGYDSLSNILGEAVSCSAVPGWRADQRVIDIKEPFNFAYNSDCRGFFPFYPKLSNGQVGTVQVPVSVPTFDEVLGVICGIDGFNEYICDVIEKQLFAVYTIHAEVEGIVMTEQFEQLLELFKSRQLRPVTLGTFLEEEPPQTISSVKRDVLVGREGWVGWQDTRYKEIYAPNTL